MTFVVIGHDSPDGQSLRRIHRAAHLARLETLDAEGRLLLAGPFTDGTGSLIVFTAASEAEAADWIAADPYVTAGVFRSFTIRPFHPVFPKPHPPK